MDLDLRLLRYFIAVVAKLASSRTSRPLVLRW